MNMPLARERRCEARSASVRRRHVIWAQEAQGNQYDGWICNRSDAGIALLVGNRHRPEVGRVLLLQGDGRILRFVVIRSSRIEPKVSLLGCRDLDARVAAPCPG